MPEYRVPHVMRGPNGQEIPYRSMEELLKTKAAMEDEIQKSQMGVSATPMHVRAIRTTSAAANRDKRRAER